MIVFVTTPGQQHTVSSLGQFGRPLPIIKVATYDRLLERGDLPNATLIFTDIERLPHWELQLAAEMYRAAAKAGIKCLNDPARVMARYELLRSLYLAGHNPFNVYRADESAMPRRFPVFIRRESDHGNPISSLILSQQDLTGALAECGRCGIPLRGLLIVEFCAEPIADGIWRKFGTFRVGEEMVVDHAVLQDTWHAKNGKIADYPDVLFQEEHDAVVANHFAAELRPAFDLAHIEFGRADHSLVGRRQVVYEINTNPNIGGPEPQRSPIRAKSRAFAMDHLAHSLRAIDSGDGSPIPIEPGPLLIRYRQLNSGLNWPCRP